MAISNFFCRRRKEQLALESGVGGLIKLLPSHLSLVAYNKQSSAAEYRDTVVSYCETEDHKATQINLALLVLIFKALYTILVSSVGETPVPDI